MGDLFMADDKGWHEPYQKAIDLLLEMKMLVPVEACEHGYIDEHDVRHLRTNEFEYECPGAGIGGNDV